MTTSARCLYCEGTSDPIGAELEHAPSCPEVTVPATVGDAAIAAQAREVARLFHHHSTRPWWNAHARLVVMCERPRAV